MVAKKVEDKATSKAGPVSEAVAAELPESLKFVSQETYATAINAATDALSGVRDGDKDIVSLNGQILLKREGNGSILFRLARTCVNLTITTKKVGKKGEVKVANLQHAAILMRDACRAAEETTIAQVAKESEGKTYKIGQIAPSWPVLKSNTINAMQKAGLNPGDFVKPSDLNTAYGEWKEANPDQKSAKGAKARITDKNGTPAAKVVADAGKKLTDGVRNSIMALVQAAQALSPSLQAEAAELIDETTKRVQALSAEDKDEDKDAPQVRRGHPIPARESERGHAPS